ncbi:MAG: sulfite exporter TauE/SafE family protein [Actinomycetaceae bacterium]|nr:sulfite exporter TauE/SafE family protein [Actinomycetaceae bacterium]
MILGVESAVVGIFVGLLAGALGIGGGILAIPVLVYLLGQDPQAATAESLVIVIVTSLAALPSRFASHQVRLATGVLFGLCSSLGAYLGTKINQAVSGDAMMYAFAALLVAVAILMLRNGLQQKAKEDAAAQQGIDAVHANDDDGHEQAQTLRKLPQFIAIGTFTGMLVGFFGIGGGFAMIPILVLVMGYSMRVAAGTSFIVITVVSVISLLLRIGSPVEIDWLVAVLFALGSGVGSAVGSPLSNRARQSTLTFVFVFLLVAVAVYTFVVTLVG